MSDMYENILLFIDAERSGYLKWHLIKLAYSPS